MLNPQSPMPLYHQLADVIMGKIRSGEYPSGARIPSENRLAEVYGIGRPTARQATDLLVRKGLLTRRRGSGTFVNERKKTVDLFSLAGTTAAFLETGISLSTRITTKASLVTVNGDDPENPFCGRKAYFFSRLSTVRNTAVLMEEIYLHPDLFAGIDAMDLAGRSLAQVVEEKYYLRPSGGNQNFRIAYLPDDDAAQMNLSPTDPVLLVKRFLHFEPADNGIYALLYCRTDQFVFSQHIGGLYHE